MAHIPNPQQCFFAIAPQVVVSIFSSVSGCCGEIVMLTVVCLSGLRSQR